MFEYDKIYNKLFQDEQFLNIIYSFYSETWRKLTKKEKVTLVNNFIKNYTRVLDIESLSSKKNKYKHLSGSYMDIVSTVNVGERYYEENANQYDLMDTLFHELRHNFQNRAIVGNLSEDEEVTSKQIDEWKINNLRSPRGFSNYMYSEGNGDKYYLQPLEEDAFKTGFSLTRKAHQIISEKYGNDIAFKLYGGSYKNLIMLYYSDEKNYVEYRKKVRDIIFKSFEENNKEYETELRCVKIAKETMEKDIKDMENDELCSLFSVYVWAYFDLDYKIELLKEYDSRVNDISPAKIEKSGNSGISINGAIISGNDVKSLLNTLFSYEFQEFALGVSEGKIDCNKKMKEELKLNLYIHDDKYVNYVKDTVNVLLYDIQPYAVYESKVVGKKIQDIINAEKKYYGISNDDYNYLVNLYDYDKQIPYIERFFEKSFKELYDDNLEKMRKTIRDLENKKNKSR